ncbi:MAG TPA: hypothetical protein DF480_03230, partial [Clostridiales bacterium]|nr:hypothetical protein [Clostridiales bacterium]
DPAGSYTITVNGGVEEEYYTLQVIQIPADGPVFEVSQPEGLAAAGVASAEQSAPGTQTLSTQVPVYETSGLAGLDDVAFETAYLKDAGGNYLAAPDVNVRVFADPAGTFDVPAGERKTFVAEFTLPNDLVQGTYTLGLNVTVSASAPPSALNEIAPWSSRPGNASIRTVEIPVYVEVPANVPAPTAASYDEDDGRLLVTGATDPGYLAVLFVDDVATAIMVPDSFGSFNGSYTLKPRTSVYEVYLKGADYSANYSTEEVFTSSITVTLLSDSDAPVITVLSPVEGAIMDNDMGQILFEVTDVLGTVVLSDITVSLDSVDLSTGLYIDGNGRYAVDLTGGLADGAHTIVITAADNSSNTAVKTVNFTSAGQPVVTFTVINGEGATVSLAGGLKTATVTSGAVIIGISDGTYSYTITKEGYKTVSGEVTVLGDTTVPTITLEVTYDVTFTITDDDSGAPVAGATITITGPGSETTGITTLAGGTATTALTDGTYSWTASASGYTATTSQNFTVAGAPLPGLAAALTEVARIDAENYKTAHAAALALTVGTVRVADETIVNAALAAYDALTAEAKAKLTAEKSLLDSLADQIEALKIAAVTDAANFRIAHAAILAETVETLTVDDKDALFAARSAYDGLIPEAKANLTAEKTLLDALYQQMRTFGFNVSGTLALQGRTSGKLDGVTITLSDGGSVVATTVTNADGSYAFDVILMGSYTLKA